MRWPQRSPAAHKEKSSSLTQPHGGDSDKTQIGMALGWLCWTLSIYRPLHTEAQANSGRAAIASAFTTSCTQGNSAQYSREGIQADTVLGFMAVLASACTTSCRQRTPANGTQHSHGKRENQISASCAPWLCWPQHPPAAEQQTAALNGLSWFRYT